MLFRSAWLTENVEHTKALSSVNNISQDGSGGNSTLQPDPQLKFLLNLYKSRIDFFELTRTAITRDHDSDAADSIRDKHMRSARKELKQAMDIFQNKLRPSSSASAASTTGGTNNNSNINYNDASSLASGTSFSEEVAAATAASHVISNNKIGRAHV